jgi:D-sedoheptulose 7-phosphate isomerase
MQSVNVKNDILKDSHFLKTIEDAKNAIVSAYRTGHKVLFAGNGGSAADAQHLAAELSGRFYLDRSPLDAEALHVNTSYLTAVANDYSYDNVYLRAVMAKAEPGDVLVAISTSGNSANILNALKYCKEHEIIIIGLTGKTGGKMKDWCDFLLNVPSTDTPRIQEAHIMIGHIICELVEKELFA